MSTVLIFGGLTIENYVAKPNRNTPSRLGEWRIEHMKSKLRLPEAKIKCIVSGVKQSKHFFGKLFVEDAFLSTRPPFFCFYVHCLKKKFPKKKKKKKKKK